MEVQLKQVTQDQLAKLWKMQVAAFQELYLKYGDTETSPATESLEKIQIRFAQPFTHYYFIENEQQIVGGIRIVDRHNETAKRISPIFIMKEHRGHGYAQSAIHCAEEIHGCNNWELDTILQEKGNCYLYEKLGYRQTGKTEKINDKMTLVFYRKD